MGEYWGNYSNATPGGENTWDLTTTTTTTQWLQVDYNTTGWLHYNGSNPWGHKVWVPGGSLPSVLPPAPLAAPETAMGWLDRRVNELRVRL